MRYKHVRAGSAEQYGISDGEITAILATGEDTDNRVTIFDSQLPKGHGAPWHYHELDDEIFYIISGKVEFGVDKEAFIANPGDLVIAGPNVPRRFQALADSKLLVINTPSGPSEGFIREISDFSAAKPPSEADKARFIEQYKIHLL